MAKRFTLLTVFLALPARAAELDELYCKRPTWAAAMTAARQKLTQASRQQSRLSPREAANSRRAGRSGRDAAVRDDGSALFCVPARTPLYFQLLDSRGRMVQTMRSWATLQPGENASCVGCHEHKNSAPLAASPVTQALRERAEPLRPFYGPPRGFSFPKEIQPILDRKCTSCHNGEPQKSFGLSGREIVDPHAKRRWSEAYLALTHAQFGDQGELAGWRGDPDHPQVNWISAQSAPPIEPPYSAGSNRSTLIALLEKGHEGATLSREELDKIAAWIDLGVPFCGDYLEANAWTAEEMEKYERYLAKRQRLAAEEKASLAAWIREHANAPGP